MSQGGFFKKLFAKPIQQQSEQTELNQRNSAYKQLNIDEDTDLSVTEELRQILYFTRGDLYLLTIFDLDFIIRCVDRVMGIEGMDAPWIQQIEKVKAPLNRIMEQYQTELLKGELKVDKQLYDLFRNELKQFKEVDIQGMVESVTKPEISDLTELRDQITKGNRSNFKMIQEVISHVEKVSQELSVSRQQQIQEESERLNETLQHFIRTLLEMFDFIDLIRMTVEQHGDPAWIKNLQQVTGRALDLLDMHGIEEIPVEGLLFDGDVMEGIGTVSPQEIQRDLAKYAVYSVTQKGFRYKEDGQMIRRAKVITVY